MKNIIICCDGTGNQLGETYSNVVKLYTCLIKDQAIQIVYYDPGVGTMSDSNVVTPWNKFFSKIGGMAFGWGLKKNVAEAYAYLMEYYQPGDRIFLYGFSRGAYTVRVLAAMIHQVGLLDRGCNQLIPYAWETFRRAAEPEVEPIALQFKTMYSRNVEIAMIGVWDTVTSYGIFNRIKLPHTTFNPSVRKIRHAMAIDERRSYYRQNLFSLKNKGDIKQVWFAGAHSDVGGSYALNESGLSQLALEWMMVESLPDLLIDRNRAYDLLYNTPGHSTPDFAEVVHNSLSVYWWPLELFPKIRRKWYNFYLPLGRRRRLYTDYFYKPITPTIHQSVLDKFNSGKYNISNFDSTQPYLIEPRVKMVTNEIEKRVCE